eukprot:2416385-Amphidinium_carterae.1
MVDTVKTEEQIAHPPLDLSAELEQIMEQEIETTPLAGAELAKTETEAQPERQEEVPQEAPQEVPQEVPQMPHTGQSEVVNETQGEDFSEHPSVLHFAVQAELLLDKAEREALIKAIAPWIAKAANGVQILKKGVEEAVNHCHRQLWADLWGASFTAKKRWDKIAKSITSEQAKSHQLAPDIVEGRMRGVIESMAKLQSFLDSPWQQIVASVDKSTHRRLWDALLLAVALPARAEMRNKESSQSRGSTQQWWPQDWQTHNSWHWHS